jgi:hypothetical protein
MAVMVAGAANTTYLDQLRTVVGFIDVNWIEEMEN